MITHTKTRLASKIVRSISTSPWLSANHYDVLGVTPKATQTEIKSAYYKLSKIHHPDKSSDDGSAKKFRDITEAYEVLGNIKLKKMYDKGLLVNRDSSSKMDYRPEPEPTDPTLKFYRSHQKRHITPTMDGRTPIYDFDAWAKNHYGDLFRKAQHDKNMLKKRKAGKAANDSSTKEEAFIYLMFALGSLFVFLVINGKKDYDENTLKQNEQNLEKNTKTN